MNYMPPVPPGTPQAQSKLPPLPDLGPGMPPIVEVAPQLVIGGPPPPPPLITDRQAEAIWVANFIAPPNDVLDYDDFNQDLMRQGGLLGLGAAKKKAAPPPPAQKVTVTAPAPLKSSTVTLVAGGALVAVVASVALWLWMRSKKD